MKKIKIKRAYTFWWKTLECSEVPKVCINDDGFGRPTIAFPLVSGDYLYIGAERIKEMRFLPDSAVEGDTNGLPDGGRVGKTGQEPVS